MMLAVEDVLSELAGEERNERGLPPGFRFHPTDEELITFYLASKILHGGLCGIHIVEVDLNRCEPWELPEMAKMGEREWYFYSLRDRKYPTGLRTNRATNAGYWKATGKDKEVFSGGGGGGGGGLVGMKKTLVFYKGRAPRGVKTKWVMHEYRLETDLSQRHTCKEEWVICRVFNKTGDRKNVGINNQISYLHNNTSLSTTTHHHNNYHNQETLPPLQEPFKTLTNSHQSPLLYDDDNYNNNLLHESSCYNVDVDELKSLINPVMSQLNGIVYSQGNNNNVDEEDNSFGVKTEPCMNFGSNDIDVRDYLENPLFQETSYGLLGLSSSHGSFPMLLDSPCPLGF